jgi:arylsulfatase A-like enzyme
MGERLRRAKLLLLGEQPRVLLYFLLPTAIALAIDLPLRGRDIVSFQPHGLAIYFSSLLVGAAFWVFPLTLAARVMARPDASRAARIGVIAFFVVWVVPIVAFGDAGQWLFFRVFRSYAGRDTLRLGALLRGSVRAWLYAWTDTRGLLFMLAFGALVAFGLHRVVSRVVRRAGPSIRARVPLLPALAFPGALVCLWTDNVDSRFLQASTPDMCFMHGVTHWLRAATTGTGRVRQGVTIRRPAPLPPLTSTRARPPNVVFVVTESVRADAMCSTSTTTCHSRFLDEPDAAPDRIALGKLTSQAPNTFSACMVLWTGLAPNVDFATAHEAPMLWEIARAVGYRTAYVTSQNPRYEDFGVYLHDAGIDRTVTALDLHGMAHEHLGAPDERAIDEALRFAREADASTPYFVVLQLSNTHHPYRVDPNLQPFLPESDDARKGGVEAHHNRFRNSVLMQERSIAGFLRDLRKLPSWDDTAVVFVSDHGEPFDEHGVVHHNHSVFDEELRVPGWLVAGSRALDDRARFALRTYGGSRTYSQDINATIVDLFGVGDARGSLPWAAHVNGRSLLRIRDARDEPFAFVATATGVWEPFDPWFGILRRETAYIGPAGAPWACYDLAHDPGEQSPLPVSPTCVALAAAAKGAFPLDPAAPR